ncbi:DALR anticodon-binding domain-containing protein [Thermopolyspora sp. NPDC052614]|uniref:DALR anticodon-binding domain-containing protein n=1 Tax=Thermopolyspora sp. NPDC052614 TaxID=3155682 RepID=UPI003430C580
MATPFRLGEILGDVPAPQGSWRQNAVYASPAALRAHAAAPELIARVRAVPGVRAVEIAPNGLMLITVTTPGEIVREIIDETDGHRPAPATGISDRPDTAARWPDLPRTWDNPGFVVRYAHARAVAVQRWARDLGLPATSAFNPALLTAPHDRAALRVLAEWPSRSLRPTRDPAPYLNRLATAYHDAHENAPAIPTGDDPFTDLHIARLRLAQAVQTVLATALTALGEPPPARI